MISELRVRGLGVIADAALRFEPGLVAFTGETGAGKTMLVTALGLVLGDRADTALVAGDQTGIEARVIVPLAGPAAERVRAAGGSVDDDGGVFVTRTLTSAGRGKATLGGVGAPVAALGDFAGHVVQRQSQSDQLTLRRPRRQREALDRFAGSSLQQAKREYTAAYDRFLRLSGDLAVLTRDQAAGAEEAQRLRQGLDEIQALGPQPGEDAGLEALIERLTHAESRRTATAEAMAALSGDDAAGDLLARAATAIARTGDPQLTAIVADLTRAVETVGEAVSELTGFMDALEADPDALEQAHRRRSRLRLLEQRYGATADDVLRWAREAEERLGALHTDGDEIARIRAEVTDAVGAVSRSAERLTKERAAAGARLAAAVTMELRALSMPGAEFQVEVERRPDERGLLLGDGRRYAFGESGADTVRFLLVAHPGARAAPIGDGASGGELSRIMLALEVVLAASAPPSVFVFDEIDAGIGGRTAIEVGRRLARLAAQSQVLVVTHLAQVAAFADQQIVVRKDGGGRVTEATIAEVRDTERARELSRMLSGQEDSTTARQHAQELLDLAALDLTVPTGGGT